MPKEIRASCIECGDCSGEVCIDLIAANGDRMHGHLERAGALELAREIIATVERLDASLPKPPTHRAPGELQ